MNDIDKIKIQIQVLTKSLRNDIALTVLRELFNQKGFDLSKTLQVTYFESEDKVIYGIIVNSNCKVYQYEYGIEAVEGKRHFDLLDITNKNNDYSPWPEISVGLNLIKNNNFCLE